MPDADIRDFFGSIDHVKLLKNRRREIQNHVWRVEPLGFVSGSRIRGSSSLH
jgi:hypothetical protein